MDTLLSPLVWHSTYKILGDISDGRPLKFENCLLLYIFSIATCSSVSLTSYKSISEFNYELVVSITAAIYRRIPASYVGHPV